MPKHPHTRNLTLRESGILTVSHDAYGEADVQPSLLPGDFIIPFPKCQELFQKQIIVSRIGAEAPLALPLGELARCQA